MTARDLVLTAGLLGCLLAAAGCTEASSGAAKDTPAAQIGTVVGLKAPDIQLLTLQGTPVTLESLKGKVVLVNFWATWCGPCLMEMPSMERLYGQFDRSKFEILAVSSDFDGAEVVKPYVDRLRLTFPILIDARFEVNNTYRVTGLPTTFIIDRDGIITYKFFGSRDWSTPESQKLVGQLLRERA